MKEEGRRKKEEGGGLQDGDTEPQLKTCDLYNIRFGYYSDSHLSEVHQERINPRWTQINLYLSRLGNAINPLLADR
jgi:hypothetical protein